MSQRERKPAKDAGPVRRLLSQFATTPRRPADPLQPGGPTAMIATATIKPRHLSAKRNESWQAMAWQYYDFCGELRYALKWKADAISRARLYIGKVSDADAEPAPVEKNEQPQAQQALAELFGGPSGQSMMLRTITLHLGVVGDSYVVGWDTPAGVDPDQSQTPSLAAGEQRHWEVRCPDEIEEASVVTDQGGRQQARFSIKLDGADYTLPDECIVIRVWDRHPRFSWQSDSPTRGVLPILHELERLTQMVIAQANSRLAGAGILLVPKEMDFPKAKPAPDAVETVQATGPGADGLAPAAPAPPAPPEPSIQTLMDALQEAMTTPITERDNPMAVVPIGLSGPAEVLKEVRHITFWTPLDENAIELRKEAIRRLALGLDVPPEIVLGLGGTSHWNGWQIEKSAITLCIEPLLGRICDALTRGYLRPYVGEGDGQDTVIWYDTAELVQQPDRGPAAQALYELEAISEDALRRENGFGEQDAPDDDERRIRAMRKLLSTAGVDAQLTRTLLEKLQYIDASEVAQTPVTAPAALKAPPASTPATPVTAQPQAPPGGPPPVPSGPGASGARTAVPRQAVAAAAGAPVDLAALVLAAHAIDHAGRKWLKGQSRSIHRTGIDHMRLHESVPVPADKVEFLLDGVWTAMSTTAPAPLLTAVHDYVGALLTTGASFDQDALAAAVHGWDQP